MNPTGFADQIAPDSLPMGWAWAPLVDTARVNPALDERITDDGRAVSFVPMAAVDGDFGGIQRPQVRTFGQVKKGYTPFQVGDVIMAKITPCMENGKGGVVRGEPGEVFFGSTEFHVLRPRRGITPEWIGSFLAQERVRRAARLGMKGSAGQLRVPEAFLERLYLPLPPTAEQSRIADRIDELFTDLAAGVAALERVKRNLSRYRAAVLHAAVTGRLTEAWRKQRWGGRPPDEPAPKLLERILAERRRQWEQRTLAKYEAKGKKPPKNWKSRYKEPSPPNTDGLSSLPEGWCWATFDQCAQVQGGLQKSPSRAPKQNHYPYLRVANVLRGWLDLSSLQRFELADDELEKLRLEHGDLLIVEGNGSVSEIGRSAIWRGEVADCVHQNHIIRARFAAVIPEYADLFVNSPIGQQYMRKVASSTSGLNTLSVGKVKSIVFPLPPAVEQAAVVEAVNEKLSQIHALEAEVDHGLARARRLRQVILKAAFEGKLVAQDANDEPAAVLLERLRADSLTAAASRTARRSKTTGQRGLYFKRAAIAAYAVRTLADSPSFGRTQLEKVLYLAQAHLDIDLSLQFKRKAAGPYDQAIHKIESLARKRGWFFTKERPQRGVRYEPGPAIADRCDWTERHLGTKLSEFDALLSRIKKMKTEQAELFATVYAAWNDLLAEGKPADPDAVVSDVRAWHESKRRFTPQRIKTCIGWMQRHSYVPRGDRRSTVIEGASE